MSTTAIKNLTLRASDGTEHAYTCTLHSADEGMPIALALMGKVARPVLEGIEALARSGDLLTGLEGIDLDAEGGAGKLLGLVAGAELGGLGGALEAALATPGLEGLIYRVLQHTKRDGKALIGPNGRPTVEFMAAYQANYREALSAAVQVVRLNGFLPLPGIS